MACTKHVWDKLKRNVRTEPLQPNLRELMSVTHQMCHSTTISKQIHSIMGNMYIAVIATADGHTMYWNEIKYDLYWYLGCPCLSSQLSVFPWSNFNEVLFYILAMNCIKLIFVYLYSPKSFPKIWKWPIRIRLIVYKRGQL